MSREIEGDGDVFPYHLLTRHHQSTDGLRIDGRRKSDSLRNPWEVSLISMNGLVYVPDTSTSTIYMYIYIYIYQYKILLQKKEIERERERERE